MFGPQASAPLQARLIVYRRGLRLMAFDLQAPSTLGSSSAATVTIPDPTLPKLQARFERSGSDWSLVDLTGQGTLVRGQPRAQAPLSNGDWIGFGECEARFTLGADGPEAEAAERRTEAGGTGAALLPDDLWLCARMPGEAGTPRAVPLRDALEIGSDPGAGLRLGTPFVSVSHARLSRSRGRLLLQDLGSTNGTSYQGMGVLEGYLPLEGHFHVGPWELWLGREAPTARPEAQLFEGMLSGDPTVLALFAELPRMATSKANVLIHGESGTGKELVARALHRLGPRASGPFVALNCATIEPALALSDLFGHEKGAYTGAAGTRAGAFVEASGGTLFLDEIAELDPAVQAKLLRALESGEIQPMGSEKRYRVDVRIVAASHRLLAAEVQAGRFRGDLYFRLMGIPCELPPLRERKGDVLLLWDHLVRAHRPPELPILTDEAREKLLRHPWPGNVRELFKAVGGALYFADGRPRIGPDDLRLDVAEPVPALGDLVDTRGKTLDEVEAAAIAATLRRLKGNRTAAARELAIDKKTLLKKLERYGLTKLGREGD
ncbi:MAG: sigma 54-interacting transcriptional regulator [Deltaproteobacteria bacterium]